MCDPGAETPEQMDWNTMKTAMMRKRRNLRVAHDKTLSDEADETATRPSFSIARLTAILFAALSLAVFLSTPTKALSGGEVESVVGVMEQLVDDLGDLAYDEEAADIWFEEDAAYEGRIAAAGFSRKTWRQALDRTMKGFFASLGQAALDAMLAPLLEFASREDLSEAQQNAARAMIAEWQAKMADWRAQGAADADVVRPFASRIQKALGGPYAL